MHVEERDIETIRPYENNPRHNDDAVDAVANSIREFGWQQPLVVDKDGVIIVGHTRLRAAKKLKMKTVPVVVADLTEEQAKAYRLADNKVGELAFWDDAMLSGELADLDGIFDVSDFGFTFDNDSTGSDEPFEGKGGNHDWEEETQQRVEHILNLDIAVFDGVGSYDIPEIEGLKKVPPVDEWISFADVLSFKGDPARTGVHFFLDDYKFERIWNDPRRYVDILRPFGVIAAPDFSPYGSDPLICQMWNHYRKHWIAAFYQEEGLTVLPTIRSSTDERSLSWFLDGEPTKSPIVYSTMWAKAYPEAMAAELALIKEKLEPSCIYVYGNQKPLKDFNVPLVSIPTYNDKAKALKRSEA